MTSEPVGPIVVVGMMASGKTTLGRALAAALGWGYLDSDETIEETVGVTGGEYAAAHGIDALHALEEVILDRHLAAGPRHVVTAAASVVDTAAGRRALVERAGAVCWIDVALAELLARLGGDDHRRRIDADELAARMARRAAWFAEVADVRIDGVLAPDDALAAALDALRAAGQ